MNLDAVVRHYRAHFQRAADNELSSFRNEGTLEAAIRRAALAESSDGKRYSHQRRLKQRDLERAAALLLARRAGIAGSTSFARLLEVVEAALRVQGGLGELYVYDVALRIGAKLGRLPERLYLHAGTREGAAALGLPIKDRKALDKFELPTPLRQIPMHEVEDMLCIYKSYLSGRVTDLEVTQACWVDEADGEAGRPE